MFRGIMLNKIRIYGDKVAIITTAILFGLFHANFSQFFYAVALGLVFAYVTLKTRTIKYSIILHIAVNMVGSVIMPAIVGDGSNIQLVGLDTKTIVLVIVTDKGDIKNTNLMANMTIDQSKLNIISDNLTKKLSGKSITEIDEDFLNYIKYEISESSVFIDELVDALNFHIEENDTSMSLSGTTNIFNYPEFSDVLRAKTFLNMLEEKENISNMLKSKGIQKENLNIIIGSDNECEVAKDCSIITATYNIDKDVVGKISLIGPTRMDYAKVYSILNYMGLLLNKK